SVGRVLRVAGLARPGLTKAGSEQRGEPPARRSSPAACAALQVKVTLAEVNVEPGVGLNITAGPAGDGVGVALPPGVGVGVGVGVGPAEHVENLNEPIRVSQLRP